MSPEFRNSKIGTAGTALGQIAKHWAKVAAHGVVGGVSSVLRGGKFAAGFLSGAVAAHLAPVIKLIPGGPIAQTAAAAVAGGVGAKLGGGKFKNGAVTGAFSYLFNAALHRSMMPQNRKVAFVGGAWDRTRTRLVYRAYQAALAAKVDAEYFSWDEGAELAAWIDANGPDVLVIGHSYGADTAAEVVASGHSVGYLRTVDPVGWSQPDFAAVQNNAGTWVNINSIGWESTWNDFIASVGGAWNSAPASHAMFFDSHYDHVGVCSYYCSYSISLEY